MNSLLVKVVVLFCVLNGALGLYFHIAETERKCFIEEVPDETTVLGKFPVAISNYAFLKLTPIPFSQLQSRTL